MLELIGGNICSLLAMVTDSVSASQKTTKGVLLVQVLSQFFYGAGAFILKGYSAVVQNVVSILRNLAATRPNFPKVFQWSFVVLGVVLGIAFNNRGLVGFLPVVANGMYSVTMCIVKDNEYALKFAFLINTLLYAIFNFAILNIVGGIGNGIVVLTTAFFLIKTKKK